MPESSAYHWFDLRFHSPDGSWILPSTPFTDSEKGGTVVIESGVNGGDGHVLGQGLSDQEAVKGVAVMIRQTGHGKGVAVFDVERPHTFSLEA